MRAEARVSTIRGGWRICSCRRSCTCRATCRSHRRSRRFRSLLASRKAPRSIRRRKTRMEWAGRCRLPPAAYRGRGTTAHGITPCAVACASEIVSGLGCAIARVWDGQKKHPRYGHPRTAPTPSVGIIIGSQWDGLSRRPASSIGYFPPTVSSVTSAGTVGVTLVHRRSRQATGKNSRGSIAGSS